MKHTILATGLLLIAAGTSAIASSVNLQIEAGQKFSQPQSKGSPTDLILANLQVKDLNSLDISADGTNGQLQYLNNNLLKKLSITIINNIFNLFII